MRNPASKQTNADENITFFTKVIKSHIKVIFHPFAQKASVEFVFTKCGIHVPVVDETTPGKFFGLSIQAVKFPVFRIKK